MPYPGSVDTLTFTVDSYDNTTGVTLVLNGPGGATLAPTPFSTDGGHTWQVNPQYSAAGEWIPTWTVTGTGAGIWAREAIWVSAIPTPSAFVPWRPELWQVAAYIPRRTLVGAVDGYGNAINTFDSTTHPTGEQAGTIVSDACAWVAMAVANVDATLQGAARAAASLWAASAIEETWPDNRDDISTAQALLDRATAMRVDLHAANTAITGTDPEDPDAVVFPVFSFPAACAWGDLNL